ncbi:MAG: SpoIIE family protein phosphatase, partial [Acidobacteriota bacterium]
DGVEEAFNAQEDQYGGERLSALVGELGKRDLSADAIRDAIVEDVKAFMGDADQKDDITVVVLKREADSGTPENSDGSA